MVDLSVGPGGEATLVTLTPNTIEMNPWCDLLMAITSAAPNKAVTLYPH